jgi:hypothetical protein
MRVGTKDNIADMLTKALPRDTFQGLRRKTGLDAETTPRMENSEPMVSQKGGELESNLLTIPSDVSHA